ncbi:MAG: hypothetical protein ACE5GT_01445 [Rhodospirillales bacterium]
MQTIDIPGLRPGTLALTFAALAAPPDGGAAAADPSRDGWPSITGSVLIEVQNDFAFSSDDPAGESNTLFTKIEPGFTLTPLKGVSIDAGLVFEPVQDPAVPGDDRVFDDQGLFVEVLTLAYARDWLTLSGGKMHVNFGSAWDVAPGVFGTDLAEEYEMAENIALAAAATAALGRAGEHTLTAQAFFLDTSGLAESAFTRRKKTREADAGPGNTGDFSSFALSVDGTGFPDLPGLRTHLAYVHQANDATGGDDERRFAVTGDWAIALAGGIAVQPLVEYVRFEDADGTPGRTRTYLTAALALTYGNWNLALSGTFKDDEAADGTDTGDEQLQVSAGYVFDVDVGVGLDVAYKRARTAGVDTDVFGTLVSYTLEF